MSELDKDKVMEDFSKAYKASNGKKPTINANNGWYSVNDGKNMRLAELNKWTKELKKESNKKPTKATKQSKSSSVKSSDAKGADSTVGLSAKDAWKHHLDSLAGDSTLPRGVR